MIIYKRILAIDTYFFLILPKLIDMTNIAILNDKSFLLFYWKKEGTADVHLFALEHRYYGKSYPEFPPDSTNSSSPVTNERLVYLSSKQAISDLAHFIQLMNEDTRFFYKNNNSLHKEKIKWMAFGGSYPGMLAAWARNKLPHLIHGAVSNSAPVQVKLDFSAYKDRVAWDLENEGIGGSKECLNIVKQGHMDIETALDLSFRGDDILSKGSIKKIAQLFNICGGAEKLETLPNINVFIGDGVIYVPAQENDPYCVGDLCNIDKVCRVVL